MPECPECGYEYEEIAEVCPECGVVLLAMEECGNCGEKVQREAEYCIHCGILKTGDKIECENHPEKSAVAVCVVCGKAVCDVCRKKKMKKSFCEDDKHEKLYSNWAVAYISSTEYEAEMVKANIENAGIDCMIFNHQDHAFFLTVGSMARINVMVPAEKLADARKIIDILFTDENE